MSNCPPPALTLDKCSIFNCSELVSVIKSVLRKSMQFFFALSKSIILYLFMGRRKNYYYNLMLFACKKKKIDSLNGVRRQP